MKKIILSILLAFACMVNVFGIKQGGGVVINPGDMNVNNTTPPIISVSNWYVNFFFSPLYKYQKAASSALITRTNKSYSVKISAFDKAFSYVQVIDGDLNLTKNEFVTLSKTSRLALTWTISTNGNSANITCEVETQNLIKNVWKTSGTKAIWLRPSLVISHQN